MFPLYLRSHKIFSIGLEKRVNDIRRGSTKAAEFPEFLVQPIDRETISAYTRWKYPKLPVKENLQELLIRDLDHSRFKTLKDVDDVVVRTIDAVKVYSKEAPDLFNSGTDYITKSIGFVDEHFRRAHGFGTQTREAFQKFSHLVRKASTHRQD